MNSMIHQAYFYFSLIFLLGRTMAISLFCAEINSESKKLIQIFRVVPDVSWCVEVSFVKVPSIDKCYY